MPSIGWRMPVEVSACTMARMVGLWCSSAASISSRLNASPQGRSMVTTSAR